MKIWCLTLACCFFVPAALPAFQETPAEGEQQRRRPAQRIAGKYRITEGAKDGEKIPAERLKDSTVAITAENIAVLDHDEKQLYAAKYTLTRGSERGTWNVELVSMLPKEGEKALGLVKRDGEQVWLIYGLDGKRPTGFEKTEKGQHLFKLKREAKEPSLTKPEGKKSDK